jgi:high-affinity Fe2+/Pb2+ permease
MGLRSKAHRTVNYGRMKPRTEEDFMLEALALYGVEWNSPFIVPVAGCLMILGIVLGGVWSSVRNREIQSRERLEAITHGRPTSDLRRRRANIRLAGVVLLASAVGLILFFIGLAAVLQERDVLCGAAVGLIPLAIGFGFLIDTKIQTREMDEVRAQGNSSV